MVNSRITVGAWFVTGGFYVPDPTYARARVKTLIAVWWGTHQLSGYVVEIVALAAAAVLAGRALMRAADAPLLVPWRSSRRRSLPFYAFVSGHPFRIRYMVPLVAACALFAVLGVGHRRGRGAAQRPAGRLLVGALAIESPLWDGTAPLLVEAQSTCRRA